MWRAYLAGQIYPQIPPYGSNWGHKIADFDILPFISFIIAFRALECIKRYWGNHMWRLYLAGHIYPWSPLFAKLGS